MKNQLEECKPEDFEVLGIEMMRTCHEVEQAIKTCAPKLQAYELALRHKIQRLQSESATLRNQARALYELLYNRIVPVCDAQMLAHSRKLWIVAFFAALTGVACLVGNVATFYLMGAGLFVAILGALGMTALPLGVGHMFYESIIATNRWFKVSVIVVVVMLAASGMVVAGQARRAMIDRSMTAPTVNSYVDGANPEANVPEPPPQSEDSESAIRRTLGEGIFLIVQAAELALAYLVGWLIELYSDRNNTAWRKLQDLGQEITELEARIARWTHAPEIAKRCCLAGILAVENSRPRRRTPYHRALTLLVIVMLLSAVPLRGQAVAKYEGILIDTSASISRGGKTNALFREYLVAARNLLLTEPPNARVWVSNISGDSFGGSQEMLKGWTPDVHGVFSDDLNRARTQLVTAFEQKSTGMTPLASATDIFGGLWRVKALFESGEHRDLPASSSKTIFIFSDMLNETKAFPMPELIELGPQKMVEHARAEGLMVPLHGYRVYVYGASTAGVSPQAWTIVKDFWAKYFSEAGAELVSYSAEGNVAR